MSDIKSTNLGDILHEIGIAGLALGATDLNAYIQAHSQEIISKINEYELDIEQELVKALEENLPTGGFWVFSRGAVIKTLTGAGTQIIADLGGDTAVWLKLAEAYLTKLATA